MQERILLSDGTGRWFDPAKASIFEEATYHNGSNWISIATGTQVDHEKLFVTAGGVYVLKAWCDCQGSGDSYEVISSKEAAIWMIKNEYELSEELETVFSQLEI